MCVCVCERECVCVCVYMYKCVSVWPSGQSARKVAGSSPTSTTGERKNLSPLALYPGPSKIVNWEPGLGWGWTRPLAVPIFH